MSESKLKQANAKKKVAILGTAPSVEKAPFNDPEWEIWGTGTSGAGYPRVDKWFQLHDVEKFVSGVSFNPPKEYQKENIKWMEGFNGTVYMHKQYPSIKGSEVFPFQRLVDKFGREFRCSPAWMMAHAINMGYGTIGLYGVDLNAEDEYAEQRPSMKFFEGWARAVGIKIEIPESSSLKRCNFLYGMEDVKLQSFLSYKKMWSDREVAIQENLDKLGLELARMKGVGEVMNMFEQDRL